MEFCLGVEFFACVVSILGLVFANLSGEVAQSQGSHGFQGSLPVMSPLGSKQGASDCGVYVGR